MFSLNSTHINSTSCKIYLWRFLDFLGMTKMTLCWPQMTPKMTKILKFPNFQRFYAMFVFFPINILIYNVRNVQQSTNSWSNSFLWRHKWGFLTKRLPLKWQSFQNFSIFNISMQFLSKFGQTSYIGMLKRVNMEPICCRVVFYEIIAVFKIKNMSNWHWNRQNFQTFMQLLSNCR